jgi:hypothetical protein
VNSFHGVEDPGQFPVFLHRFPENVRDHRRPQRPEEGEFLFDEGVDADVLKPHGVEHARGRLHDPGRGVTRPGLQGEPLDDHGPETAQIDVGAYSRP